MNEIKHVYEFTFQETEGDKLNKEVNYCQNYGYDATHPKVTYDFLCFLGAIYGYDIVERIGIRDVDSDEYTPLLELQ